MPLDITTLLDRAVSHAMAAGLFERVNGHEPKNAPGAGLTAALWAQNIGPARRASGLDSTTIRLELAVRLYSSLQQEPQDAIDPELLAALDVLLAAYSGDFTLGDAVRQVDLLGAYGTPLGAQAGYLAHDGVVYRVFTITLPLIVNDLWNQEA